MGTGTNGAGSVAGSGRGRGRLPAGFLAGVSDSAFQSEGGMNGPGEPANNWAPWERSGRAQRSGLANQFWTRYPEHFERAAEAGCEAYRLSVEWARCEPSPSSIDTDALAHYGSILRAAHAAGLEPVVALHHFTHPSWLGLDFWLTPDAPSEFARWVRTAVTHLAPWCRRWTTVNEPNALAIGSYLIGYFPPGRRLRPDLMMRALDNLLTAHVEAYGVIHELQPDAEVGTSTFAFWPYDVDRVIIDVLCSRGEGVGPDALAGWLANRRRDFERQVFSDLDPAYVAWQRAIGGGLRALLRPERTLRRTVAAVAASPHDRCLDVVQVNYYDPNLSNYLHLPGRRTAGRRHWGPDPEHWEQKPGPEHFATYLRASAVEGLPTVILENGLCSAVVDGRAHERADGWDRPRYLEAHLDAVLEALDDGVDVRGYFTWSLFDNYQWGEYESRFGLFAVERPEDGGDCKFGDLDAMGRDAAGAYRALLAQRR